MAPGTAPGGHPARETALTRLPECLCSCPARCPGPRLLPHTLVGTSPKRQPVGGELSHPRTHSQARGKLLEGVSKAPQVGGAGRRRPAGQEGWEDQGGSRLISRPGRRWSHPEGGEVSGQCAAGGRAGLPPARSPEDPGSGCAPHRTPLSGCPLPTVPASTGEGAEPEKWGPRQLGSGSGLPAPDVGLPGCPGRQGLGPGV